VCFENGGGDNIRARVKYTRTNKVIDLQIDVLGETLYFDIEVGKERAKLSDLVSLARNLCNKITETVVRRTISAQRHIPCDKGCSACCGYLVPLSVPEALRLKEEIDAAPAYQRELMMTACLRQARFILSHKPPKPPAFRTEGLSPVESVDLNLMSDWYSNLTLSCPFLDNHLCSIYEQRPLACREHYITGSAGACRSLRGDAKVINMPIQMANVLGQLASELEDTEVEAVILPLVPVWYEENSERAERNWPAEEVVGRFIEIIEATVQRSVSVVAARKQPIIEFSGKRRVTNQLYRLSSG